jgi:hypothetical protein
LTAPELFSVWCLTVFGPAAIWLVMVASIPSLNVTPVVTLVGNQSRAASASFAQHIVPA